MRSDGADVVPGYACDRVPGLAVSIGVGTRWGRWCVTHLDSGRAVGPLGYEGPPASWATRDEAIAAAEALAPLGDWERSDDEIMADEPFRLAARAVLVAHLDDAALSSPRAGTAGEVGR